MSFREIGAQEYPLLEAARKAAQAADDALRQAMREQFPKGARVRVNHYSGSFTGVVGHTDDCRVYVINDKTGKRTGRYPLIDCDGRVSVELIE